MSYILLTLLLAACWSPSLQAAAAVNGRGILVLGSVNMDITVDVARLPLKGETTTSISPSVSLAVGGKGANQAVAAARLSNVKGNPVRFICRFGNDSYADMLQKELASSGVDLSGCAVVHDLGSGQGIVMLEPDGAASSIVVGGANTAWDKGDPVPAAALSGVGVLMLQREVPESVNLAAAQAAAAAGIPVMLDAGGADRRLPPALAPLVTYLCPNELELQALTGQPTRTHKQVVAAARSLLKSGVSSVLVTLSERGAVLVDKNGTVTTQSALPVPGGTVVDGTAAGDAFRAGFAVGLVDDWSLQQCLQFAAAAGALAVARKGALPSLPSYKDVVAHLQEHANIVDPELISRLGAEASSASHTCSSTPQQPSPIHWGPPTPVIPEDCPLKFASRLNSMQARRDLVLAHQASTLTNDVLGWIARQGLVEGLDLVDLNYPQHFQGVDNAQIQAALDKAGLHVGAINIRFPHDFVRGAFTNPDSSLRAAAVQLAEEAFKKAYAFVAKHVVVWSPYDGYDLNLQVDYNTAWQHTVDAFKQLRSSLIYNTTLSLEFKPTDPATRFSIVPNTASALLLAQEVGGMFGLTLDVGHMLLAGENPAQSIAMVARAGMLKGLHLNDAHTRLGAEDGLPFGSVNEQMALEVVRQLQKINYQGHIYFDTFPTTMDPVGEAEWNIRMVKALWRQASLFAGPLDELSQDQDALGVLRLLHDGPYASAVASTVLHKSKQS